MATFVVVDSRPVTSYHLKDFVSVRIKQNNKNFNSARDVLEKYPFTINMITDYMLSLFEEGQFVNISKLSKCFDFVVEDLKIDCANLDSFELSIRKKAEVSKHA